MVFIIDNFEAIDREFFDISDSNFQLQRTTERELKTQDDIEKLGKILSSIKLKIESNQRWLEKVNDKAKAYIALNEFREEITKTEQKQRNMSKFMKANENQSDNSQLEQESQQNDIKNHGLSLKFIPKMNQNNLNQDLLDENVTFYREINYTLVKN